MSERFLGPLRRMIGMVDDVPPVRRGVELPIQSEADAMRFLGDLSEQDAAFRTRFGFDPERLWPPGVDVTIPARRMDAGVPSPPDFALDSPLFADMNKADRAFDNLRTGRTANLRNQPYAGAAGRSIRDTAEDAIRAMQRDRQAEALRLAGGAAGAVGLGAMIATTDSNLRPPQESPAAATAPAGVPPALPAQSPAPMVPPPAPVGLDAGEQQFVDTFKAQLPGHQNRVAPGHSADRLAMQAKQMLADVNASRRAAGGEVPDGPRVMQDAQELLDQANAIRNDPEYRPLPQQGVRGQKAGARQQAIALIQELNADRQRAGGEVPDARQRMAVINALLARADQEEALATSDLAAESRPLPASTPRTSM